MGKKSKKKAQAAGKRVREERLAAEEAKRAESSVETARAEAVEAPAASEALAVASSDEAVELVAPLSAGENDDSATVAVDEKHASTGEPAGDDGAACTCAITAGDAAEETAEGATSDVDACACRHKETERAEKFQADIQRRLNRVIGQLNGVKSMIDDNRYCGDVLVQLAAAESAVHRVSEMVLQDHMETCVVEQIREGNVEVVDEAMKLIRKFM